MATTGSSMSYAGTWGKQEPRRAAEKENAALARSLSMAVP